MNSKFSVVRSLKTSDTTETPDAAPPHVKAHNIAIDFYLEGRILPPPSR